MVARSWPLCCSLSLLFLSMLARFEPPDGARSSSPPLRCSAPPTGRLPSPACSAEQHSAVHRSGVHRLVPVVEPDECSGAPVRAARFGRWTMVEGGEALCSLRGATEDDPPTAPSTAHSAAQIIQSEPLVRNSAATSRRYSEGRGRRANGRGSDSRQADGSCGCNAIAAATGVSRRSATAMPCNSNPMDRQLAPQLTPTAQLSRAVERNERSPLPTPCPSLTTCACCSVRHFSCLSAHFAALHISACRLVIERRRTQPSTRQ